jgi:hypothetical protein
MDETQMSRHLFPVTLQKIIEIAENKTVANPFLLVTDLLLQLGIQFQYRSQVSPTAQTSSIPFPFYLISSESADPWSPFWTLPNTTLWPRSARANFSTRQGINLTSPESPL